MVYEHDPESPSLKILVKNDSSIVGIIRRDLRTGDYYFYDSRCDTRDCLFMEKRIDRIKKRIEGLLESGEAV